MELIELEEKTKQGEDFAIRYFPKENPALTGRVPKGYMTGKEFFGRIREDIAKMYKGRGLL